jgi:opacity protein-like surface antigen
MRRITWGILVFACLITVPALAQGTAAKKPADDGIKLRLQDLERQVLQLGQELERSKKSQSEDSDEIDDMGFQLQLRFEYYTLAHNRRNDVFSPGEDEQFGLGGGIGLRLPLWIQIFDGVDLLGFLDIVYRQNNKSGTATAPISGVENTSSYANIIAGPQIRFSVSETIRPSIFIGGNLQVQTPPTDGITYLDAGFTAGAALDIRATKKVSIGFDYKFTWMGVGDQEDSDYGSGGVYVGFNF